MTSHEPERTLEGDAESEPALRVLFERAGIAVASGATFSECLEELARTPELPNDKWGLANAFVDGLGLGSARSRRELADDWAELEPATSSFLNELANRSRRSGLQNALTRSVEMVLLSHASQTDRLRLARRVALSVKTFLHGVPHEGTTDTLLCDLRVGARSLWSYPVPVYAGITGVDLRSSLTREIWRRVEARALTSSWGSRMLAQRVSRAHALAKRAVRRATGQRLTVPSPPSPTLVPLDAAARVMVEQEERRAAQLDIPAEYLPVSREHVPEPGNGEGSTESWDRFFEREDPWSYESPYEQEKYERTLSLIPERGVARALELAAAEGHFTCQLATRVNALRATDISSTALARNQRRCAELGNVRYDVLNAYDEPLGGPYDLIVCSEVLYYMRDRAHLAQLVEKLAGSLEPGGIFVHAHAFDVVDDPARTGFDWGVSFAAKVISEALGASAHFVREVTLSTELYLVERYRRVEPAQRGTSTCESRVLPLTPELEDSVAGSVIWNGAVITRAAAEECERAYDVPVLMYHRIATDGPVELADWRVSPRDFEHQLRFLKRRGYRSISIDEWDEAASRSASIRGRPLLITFDDAYLDFYEVALPILQRNGFSALVFVVADRIGGHADWDRHYGAPAQLMNIEQLADIARRGVTIGSHLASHTAADCLTSESLLREAAYSRALLSRLAGYSVDTVAAPYGATDARIEQVCAAAGFKRLFADAGGRAPITGLRMRTPRIDVLGSDSLDEFARKVGVREPPQTADLPAGA